MHEQSLVRALLRQVAVVWEQNERRPIESIEVEVGPLSGVESDLLNSAFLQLRHNGCADNAQLVIQQIGLVGFCSQCQAHHPIVDFDFRCPACAQGLRVTRGDSLMLLNVVLRDVPNIQAASFAQESTDDCTQESRP